MEARERHETIVKLQEKLSECEASFDAAARRRGFDPAQAENMALPATLARLFSECAELRSELDDIIKEQKGE